MDCLLTLNAGSSSLKFARYPLDGGPADFSGQADGLGTGRARLRVPSASDRTLPTDDLAGALAVVASWLAEEPGRPVRAVAHRIVHGGPDFATPMILDETVMARLEALVPLAPLHQPQGLAGVRLAQRRWPQALQVACFDTAFHRTQPEIEQRYALPEALWQAGVRRYGFHGLSYASIAARLPTHLGEKARGRVVVAHLGNGASACALYDLKSVATTMGFTALDGLMMGTRCGRLDPGVVLHLQQALGYTLDQVAHLLYHEAGLLGVSAQSPDMRVLQASDRPQARLALELFAHMAAREVAGLMPSLGGIDALVFTGGIGEHQPAIRAAIVERLAWAGLKLDAAANARQTTRLSPADAPVSVWMLPADEEAVLADAARAALGCSQHGGMVVA
jgi:acetate kinase